MCNYSDPFGLEPCTAAQLDAGWTNIRGQDGKPECESPTQLPAVTSNAQADDGSQYCALAQRMNVTVFSGLDARVALMYGFDVAGGVYASPSEFGTYSRFALLFGLEGSAGWEFGGNVGGLKGLSFGVNGATSNASVGASLGILPSPSATGVGGLGGSPIPLTGSLELAYTHTRALGSCPQ